MLGGLWICNRFRTLKLAVSAVTVVWLTSFALMFPVLLFVAHVPQTNRISGGGGVGYSCVVQWPISYGLTAARAYLTYTAVVGFACPLVAIVGFYALLICRLRFTRSHIRSRGVRQLSALRDPTRRHVVNVVTLIVVTYIVCWLPYWSFQVRHSSVNQGSKNLDFWFLGF